LFSACRFDVQIKKSSKRIDDRNTLCLATVAHFFGISSRQPARASVPISRPP
jgi:hypothetical protein